MKILAVIPARSGSKGIPKKNMRVICGKPLMAYSIAAAQEANLTQRVIVSTDSEEFAAIARSYGAETPFLRPAELSGDRVTLIYVLQHALAYFDAAGEHYDAVLSIQASAPLIKPSTIDAMIRKMIERDCECVGTASQIRHGHPYLARKLEGPNADEAVLFTELPAGVFAYPRQARPDLFFFNGVAFLRKRSLLDHLDERTNALGTRPLAVIIGEEESINIDDRFDLHIAEILLTHQNARSEYRHPG